MIRTQIQLTEEQAKTLKAMAADRGVSVAELIRQGVSELIASSNAIDYSERIKRAIQAAGRFHSRKSNISVKHDRYLDEAYSK
ncbi:ribbon-helix-helix domain-containing protein [bacterium]|nr:ribbon-helix-helix domain-containing protein [bacterium]